MTAYEYAPISSMYNEHYTKTIDTILKELGYKVIHAKAYAIISRDCIDHQCVVIDKWKEKNNIDISSKYLKRDVIIEEECENDYELFYENYTCKGTNLYINMTELKKHIRLGHYINWIQGIDIIDYVDVSCENDKIILRFYNEWNKFIGKTKFDGNLAQAEDFVNKLQNGMPKTTLNGGYK